MTSTHRERATTFAPLGLALVALAFAPLRAAFCPPPCWAAPAAVGVGHGRGASSSLGDRVWSDTDADGVQDAGETGLDGVDVELLDSGGNVIGASTTAGNGIYSFGSLTAATYTVRVVSSTLPAGSSPTFDLDGTGTPHRATAALAAGQTRTDVDFGYRFFNGSLGDRVWSDADGDGVQDAGEVGLNGVSVELLDSGANVIGATTTAGDGNYSFGPLAPATLTVRVVAATLPAGSSPSFDLDGTGTPHRATVALAAGQTRTDVDFGYRFFNGSLGDRVWSDGDGDGVQDAGEVGLNDVNVELLDSGGTVLGTTTTAGDGSYSFGPLAPATLTVRVVAATLPAGSTPTFDLDGTGTPHLAAATLAVNQTRTDLDFGYVGVADLSITMSDGLSIASPGQAIDYTVVVANAGPGAAAGVAVDVALSAALGGPSWTCAATGGASCGPGGSGSLADTASLPAGSTATYLVQATVDAGFVGNLSSDATLTAIGISDPTLGDHAANDSTIVSSPAGLSATKTVSGDFRRGGTVVYSLVVRNAGPQVQLDNPGPELTDTLPATLTLDSAAADAGTVATAGNTITWNGSVAVGASVHLAVTATISHGIPGATISNQASLAWDADGNGSNEAAGTSDDPDTTAPGDPTSFGVGIAEVPRSSTVGRA